MENKNVLIEAILKAVEDGANVSISTRSGHLHLRTSMGMKNINSRFPLYALETSKVSSEMLAYQIESDVRKLQGKEEG